MKRFITISVIVMVTIMVFTGCGDKETKNKKDDGVEEIRIEEIRVEEIQTEEIRVEEIQTERIYIDGEYEAESNFNNRVNSWEDSSTYWD